METSDFIRKLSELQKDPSRTFEPKMSIFSITESFDETELCTKFQLDLPLRSRVFAIQIGGDTESPTSNNTRIRQY